MSERLPPLIVTPPGLYRHYKGMPYAVATEGLHRTRFAGKLISSAAKAASPIIMGYV